LSMGKDCVRTEHTPHFFCTARAPSMDSGRRGSTPLSDRYRTAIVPISSRSLKKNKDARAYARAPLNPKYARYFNILCSSNWLTNATDVNTINTTVIANISICLIIMR